MRRPSHRRPTIALRALGLALILAAAADAQELPLTELPAPGAPPPKPKPAETKPKEGKPEKPRWLRQSDNDEPRAEKSEKKKKAAEPAAPVDDSGALIAAPATAAPAQRAHAAETAPLPDVPLLQLSSRIAVAFVRSALFDEATAVDIESGLRGVAFQAPLSQNPIVLRSALGAGGSAVCRADDDACFTSLAAKEGADSVLIAVADKSPEGFRLRERQLWVAGKKKPAPIEGSAPADPLALKAQAEALACKLLVPTGCAGEVALDAGADDARVSLLFEGRALTRSSATGRYVAPLGLASLALRVEGRTGPARVVPVLREKPASALRVQLDADGTPSLILPPDPLAAAPEAAVAGGPGTRARWTKPAGYTVAGVGGAALIGGLVEGLHAKSLQSDATTAFNANGGAWKAGDLGTLGSGNSAAHTANLLLLIGGIAAAAGLACALAF